MMKRIMLAVTVSGLALSGCDVGAPPGAASDPSQIEGDRAAPQRVQPTDLAVSWQPLQTSQSSVWFTFKLTIENRGHATLGNSGWHLNFSFVHRLLNEGEGDSGVFQNLTAQGVRAGHADKAQSGDYWVMEPLASFAP